jgi:hypothetical protein
MKSGPVLPTLPPVQVRTCRPIAAVTPPPPNSTTPATMLRSIGHFHIYAHPGAVGRNGYRGNRITNPLSTRTLALAIFQLLAREDRSTSMSGNVNKLRESIKKKLSTTTESLHRSLGSTGDSIDRGLASAGGSIRSRLLLATISPSSTSTNRLLSSLRSPQLQRFALATGRDDCDGQAQIRHVKPKSQPTASSGSAFEFRLFLLLLRLLPHLLLRLLRLLLRLLLLRLLLLPAAARTRSPSGWILQPCKTGGADVGPGQAADHDGGYCNRRRPLMTRSLATSNG